MTAARTPPAEPVEVRVHGFAHGGEAVGRRPDGKVCFVAHALPGERVRVRIETEHRRWSRGHLVEVLEASPDRVTPPCPYAGPGRCGGCTLQHATVDRQATLLRQVLVDQLERIGKIAEPPVTATRQPHAGTGNLAYRTRARFSVAGDGRLGFHRHASGDIEPVDHCRLLTDAAHRVRREAGDDWRGTDSVTVRAGDGGARLLEVVPGQDVLATLPGGDAALVLVDALGVAHSLRGDPALSHTVHGRAFRVSATGFFQPGPAAAEVLVTEVLDGAAVHPGDRILDLYCGVGLFSWFLADAGATVTAYEAHAVAVEDARHNLTDRDVEVVAADAAQAVRALADADVGDQVDTAVLDPPRQGAGEQVSHDVARLAPRRIVYVACDPAALARDARVLVARGYRLVRVVPVDQFSMTGHVEAVATFLRH